MLEKFTLPATISLLPLTLIKADIKRVEELFSVVDKNRAHLRRFLPWLDYAQNLEGEIYAVNEMIKNWEKSSEFVYFIINNQNQIIGTLNLFNIDYQNYSAMVGYWLAEDQTGHGYVTQALQHLINLAFNNGLVRLTLRCDPENSASNNVAKRCGFTFEACIKMEEYRYGQFYDSNHYYLINPQYL